MADTSTAAVIREPRSPLRSDRARDRTEIEVFRSFLTAHSRITKSLEAALLAEHQMSLAAFDVFAQLHESPGHCLRMTELSDAVLLSRSGVTRLVERLEQEGLVRRGRATCDGRGVTATLTEQGLARFHAAVVTQLRGIREHFISRLTTIELAALGLICTELAVEPRRALKLDADLPAF
jgi:DNA-binding MarR family transcriptional regulator